MSPFFAKAKEPDRLPGSFPADDMTSTPHDASRTSDTHDRLNKLYKNDDPKEWSEEDKLARGHKYTDSGVGLTERHHPIRHGQTGEPGFITGAFSRTDKYSDNSDSSQTTSGRDHTPTDNRTAGEGAGVTGGAAAAAKSSTMTKRESNGEGRNVVRNGRDHSNVTRQDPYWAERPHGSGVYNTVTGHGSNETPAAGSGHHNTDPAPTHGVYNTVIGHGSGSGSSQVSVTGSNQVQKFTSTDGQQRAFPLGGAAEHKTNDPASQHTGSHFKEDLAGTGVGASAGLAAYELTQRRRENELLRGHDEPSKHADPEAQKESKVGGGLFHHDSKDKEPKAEKKHETKEEKVKESTYPKHNKQATATAAAAGAFGTHESLAERSQKNKNPVSENNTYASPTEKATNSSTTPPDSKEPASESKPVHALAGAGAGVGVIYAGHRYADHKDAEKAREQVASSAEPLNQKQQQATTTPGAAAQQPTSLVSTSREPLETGTTTGPASNNQAPPPLNTKHHHRRRTSAVASHGAQYNALASGTSSGINIGDGDHGVQTLAIRRKHSPPQDTAGISNTHVGAKAATAAVGASASAGATKTLDRDQQGYPVLTTGAAGKDLYNHLASGTPSGINIGGGSRGVEKHRKSSPTASSPTSSAGTTGLGTVGAYYAKSQGPAQRRKSIVDESRPVVVPEPGSGREF
ncbi:hypothetical protein F4779DRAFT_572280 [Xylariaceae sp. FL0662B]|nr:hypothetical protein F4779DRAFT_572280 [Xylariaceae sp. FL0662B]